MFSKKHKNLSLRFRQWRRKSYAAFNSIGKHVTIGNVKNVVADTLLRKQKNIDIFVDNISSFLNEGTLKEAEDPADVPRTLQGLIPVVLQEKKYYGNIEPHYLFIHNKWLKMVPYCFQPFYFPTKLKAE